jgi:3-hydroxybutyryl-CoA dehydratase
MKIGDNFNYQFSFSQDDVIRFAEASGDFNPIHLDSEYAKNTFYKKTIVHGFLGGSVFSKIFGTIFPGSGTIYLKQDLVFYKPMFINVKYTAVFEVIKTDKSKNRATVKTIIIDESNQITTKGEALIKHPSIC